MYWKQFQNKGMYDKLFKHEEMYEKLFQNEGMYRKKGWSVKKRKKTYKTKLYLNELYASFHFLAHAKVTDSSTKYQY